MFTVSVIPYPVAVVGFQVRFANGMSIFDAPLKETPAMVLGV